MNKVAFLLALSLAGITVGCNSRQEAPRVDASAAPITVKAATVSEVEWPSVYEASGTVRARTTAQVSSRLMAYVREVRVRVGDRVRQGQLLVTLDAADEIVIECTRD